MKVVILSGCGFLGLHIAKKLIQNNIKTVLVDTKERFANPLDPSQYQRVEIEYPYQNLDPLKSVLSRGDVLIHLGWSQVPNDDAYSFRQDIAGNALMSAELFSMAREAGVGKVIFASSGGAVYGNVGDSPIHEKCETNPVSSYGIGKLAAEKYLALLTSDSSTSHVILRIGNAYGNHLSATSTPTGLITFMIKKMLLDQAIEIWGDGEVVRDFIYASDIADAFYLAVTQQNAQGVYNIGTGQGKTIRDVISCVETRLKRSAKINWSDGRSCDVEKVILDSSKFKALTDWKPQINLQQGIDMIASRLEQQ